MEEILKVERISQTYQAENGELTALDDISFSVEKGEFVSIVGPSGCGKSTLLSIVAGMIRPTYGRVLLQGEPVEGISPHIGYMLQRDNLLEWRNIYQKWRFQGNQRYFRAFSAPKLLGSSHRYFYP